MSTEELRKVKVNDYTKAPRMNYGSKQDYEIEDGLKQSPTSDAYFHRWGDKLIPYSDVEGTMTVAIIEYKDTGEVKSVEPDDIRFVEEF